MELPDIPPMVPPSAGSTAVFVSIVIGLVVLFVWGVARVGPGEGRRRRAVVAAVGMGAWLAATAGISASGVLEAKTIPPPAMFFMVANLGIAAALAFSRVGTRLLEGAPVFALVGFQAFRLPLELVLHQWWEEGVLPVQMTFQGSNFDIVTGILAIAVGAWAWRGRAPRAAILGFNLVGSALLVTVATIAVLSAPLPFRQFTNDPPVLLPFHFPYSWIVPFCVGGALFGHLLVFRWLWKTREQESGLVTPPSVV